MEEVPRHVLHHRRVTREDRLGVDHLNRNRIRMEVIEVLNIFLPNYLSQVVFAPTLFSLGVPLMSQRQMVWSSEAERRCPFRLGFQLRP